MLLGGPVAAAKLPGSAGGEGVAAVATAAISCTCWNLSERCCGDLLFRTKLVVVLEPSKGQKDSQNFLGGRA